MKFDEIDNLSEEQVLELYDEVLETNNKSAVTYYTMHVMCTDGSLQTAGKLCGSDGGHLYARCPIYVDITAGHQSAYKQPCTARGKVALKFCCD